MVDATPARSLAVRAHWRVDATPSHPTPLRLFDGHVHRLALLAIAELGVVMVCVYGAVLVRFSGLSGTLSAFQATEGPIWPRALLIAGVILLGLAAMGLYQLRQRARFAGIVARLLIALVMAEGALGLIFYLAPSLYVGRGVFGLAGIFAFFGLALTRLAFLRVVDEDIFKRRVLVWGAGARAATIAKRLRRSTDQRGFKIVGHVRTPGDGAGVPDHQVLQFDGDLLHLAMRHKVEQIVVAMDDRRRGFPAEELLECRLRGIAVYDVLAFLERETGRVSVELMQSSWFIFSNGFRCDIARLASKRLFDVAVSIAVLLAASPIALLTAIAIFLEDRGPILYRQIRTGQNGRKFSMLKFRSMRIDAEPAGQAIWASRNDPRTTRVGAWLRRLRIDELPQVLNVLVGQMSFVGPRPERPAFVQELTQVIPYYPERHFVKPGITGWAQVRYSYGSSNKDAQEKLEYDLYYVKHHSFAFDLMVLLQTFEIVLLRIGSR
jgi:sugar transferase (PEP-CTERM system associated)